MCKLAHCSLGRDTRVVFRVLRDLTNGTEDLELVSASGFGRKLTNDPTTQLQAKAAMQTNAGAKTISENRTYWPSSAASLTSVPVVVNSTFV